MADPQVVGKTILQLDPLTGEIDLANSYIEVHVVGQTSSQKVPLSNVAAEGQSAYDAAVAAGFVGTEAQWLASLQGADGKSAYQSALDTGFVGTEAAFVTSLKGAKGDKGDTGDTGVGVKGDQGDKGDTGNSAYQDAVAQGYAGTLPQWLTTLVGAKGDKGDQGDQGVAGDSAYTVAVAGGFVGNQAAWLASLKGVQGDKGTTGDTGAAGQSAYQEAVTAGYAGTEGQWLASLKGANGNDGKSAYEVAVADGFVGTEAAWLTSLHGASAYQDAVTAGFVGDLPTWLASLKGAKGDQGDKGDTGTAGSNAVLGHLVGSVATSADLPDVTGFEQADYFMVGTHIWMNLNGEWTDMGNFQGVPGQDGSGITVLGELPSPDYLPVSGARNGDSWLIGKVMYVWNGTAWQLQGQQGLQGEKGDIGATGPQGPSAWDVIRAQHPEINTLALFTAYITGPQGLKGDTAISFVADGKVAAVGDMPAVGTNNHGYLVGNDTDGYDFWVWINTAYVDLGRNVGPKGDQGVKGDTGDQGPAGKPMTAKGVLANTSLLPTTNQQVGDTYSIAGHFWSWDGAQFVDNGDFTGEQGPVGDAGPTGPALTPKGQLAAVGDLPTTGNNLGDAYEIGGFIYVYNSTTTTFVNMGQWRGTSGTNGTNGQSAFEIAVAAGFTGDQAEWIASLKGADGVSFSYLGQFANVAALPAGDQTGKSATTLDTEHIYLYMAGTGWVDNGPIGVQGPQGFKGDTGADGASAFDVAVTAGFNGTVSQWLASLKGLQGDSAFQVAVAGGFAGTQAQWLASLVGAKGDQGDKGDKGDIGTTGNTGNTGESAYQAAVDGGFVGNQAAWIASLHGADGQSAYALAVAGGFVGDQTAWIASLHGAKGDTGDQGVSLTYIGDFASAGVIPAGTISQVATAVGHIYINNGTTWVDAGPVAQGPQGDKGDKGDIGNTGATGNSAYQDAVASGAFTGTLAAWLASLKGATGDSAVQAAVTAGLLQPGATIADYVTLTTGPKGDVGDQGPTGNTGPAISIIGTVADEASLPATGTVGTGYAIPDSATPGTYNCYIWLEATTQWFNLGHVVGAQGPKGDQGLRGLQGVTGNVGPTGPQGTLWIVFARDPQALDGRIGDYFYNSNTQEFFTKTDTATWASLGHIGGGNLNAPAQTGKFRGYSDAGWVDLPGILQTIPTDAGTYQLVNGAWKAMDTYTLKAVDVAIIANVGTVDFNVARIFRIQNTAATTINLTNIPDAAHGTTVVVKVYGKVGAFTWTLPTGTIRWFDGAAPTFANAITTIVFTWDGTEMVASVPN